MKSPGVPLLRTIRNRLLVQGSNVIAMERKKCQYCDKEAIGYQGFGCCSAYVCADHAHTNLLALRPGENLSGDECYLERYF